MDEFLCEGIYTLATYSESRLLRETAQTMLKLLVTHVHSPHLPPLSIFQASFPLRFVSYAVEKIPVAQMFALSAEDLAIYRDPAEALQTALEAHRAAQAEAANAIKVTNADRKKAGPRSTRKGQFGADLADDEDWVERLKQVSPAAKRLSYLSNHSLLRRKRLRSC
jgi:hypothetical protein